MFVACFAALDYIVLHPNGLLACSGRLLEDGRLIRCHYFTLLNLQLLNGWICICIYHQLLFISRWKFLLCTSDIMPFTMIFNDIFMFYNIRFLISTVIGLFLTYKIVIKQVVLLQRSMNVMVFGLRYDGWLGKRKFSFFEYDIFIYKPGVFEGPVVCNPSKSLNSQSILQL